MARPQSRYICQRCAEAFLRWEGQCRACGEWNSLVETIVHEPARGERSLRPAAALPQPARLSELHEANLPRVSLGIGELDRVLGGGLVPGSLVLLGGEPGIGKSTLLLQAAAGLARGSGTTGGVLYASGEESPGQIRLRAERLGLLGGASGDGIRILSEHDVGRIAEVARATRPALVIVDSIQTATVEELDGAAGSVGQVREAALRLMDLAKGDGIAVILVGHVTKDGSIAGPKTLEHLVDAVVSLEGERHAALRLLRAAKNRFGSTDEVGVFEMNDNGMMEVADPARAFLSMHRGPAPGSIVAPTMDGSRPLLVEVQALVNPTGYGTPTRKASGVDPNRLSLLIAVLGRRAGVALGGHDVYANLAGGLTVMEPGLDLPVAMALVSSLRDQPISPGTISIGEVGLIGELRGVVGLERRLREAARLGFRRAVVPRSSSTETPLRIDEMEIQYSETLAQALEVALDPRAGARGEAVPSMLG